MVGKLCALVIIAVVAFTAAAHSGFVGASGQTVGLISREPGATGGYTLFAPMRTGTTYLIDDEGMVVQSWESDYIPSASVYLLENGNLLRTGRTGGNPTWDIFQGEGGRIEEFDNDGNLVWEFEYDTSTHIQHHDIEPLPNGNLLILAWELKDADEAIAAGRDPARLAAGELWPEHVVEVEPADGSGGNIVWEWHMWDHLIQEFDPTKDNFGAVANHPELINVNHGGAGADINHANSVDYNAELDQIMISVRHYNEIWVIDHSTSTDEAAGHSGGDSGMGGDLLYRWGNPATYLAGDESDQTLFWQHDARWVPSGLPGEGNIMIFNNGPGREVDYSSVDEITPPVDASGSYTLTPGQAFGPPAPTWTYEAQNRTDFYSSFISGAHRLPNGNTFVSAGAQGRFFEVTPEGEILWDYISPVTADGPITQGEEIEELANIVFRAHHYPVDYPGLQGKDLIPQGPVEQPKPTPTATNTPPTATPSCPERGDANGDGLVNAVDAALVLQYVGGFIGFGTCGSAFDANGDDDVTSIDAALILQLTAGLLNSL